jgi:hypothetical protein
MKNENALRARLLAGFQLKYRKQYIPGREGEPALGRFAERFNVQTAGPQKGRERTAKVVLTPGYNNYGVHLALFG